MMKVNVIMPSNRNANDLIDVLSSYKKQTYKNYIISIIKEGETETLKNVCKQLGLKNVRLLSITQKCNAAYSRNYGLLYAKDDELIVFSDDDMIVSETFIEEHVISHKNNMDTVVRGIRYQKTEAGTWYIPSWEASSVMRWEINGRNDNWIYFVTSNSSIPMRLVKKVGGFDVNFVESGCEDTEFAYRLKKEGLNFISNRNAINYHTSIDNVQEKFEKRINNFKYFKKKYSEDRVVCLFVDTTILSIENKQIEKLLLKSCEENKSGI